MREVRIRRSELPAKAQFTPLIQLLGLLQSSLFFPFGSWVDFLKDVVSLGSSLVNLIASVMGLFA